MLVKRSDNCAAKNCFTIFFRVFFIFLIPFSSLFAEEQASPQKVGDGLQVVEEKDVKKSDSYEVKWFVESSYQHSHTKRVASVNHMDAKEDTYSSYSHFLIKGGIGFTPFSSERFKSSLFYRYSLGFDNVEKDFDVYFDDAKDMDYFPLHPAYSIRDHEFLADILFKVNSNFKLGFFGSYEMEYVGSSLFDAAEEKEADKEKIKETYQFQFFGELSIVENHATRLTINYVKYLDFEDSLSSYENQDLEKLVPSDLPWVIEHSANIPEYQVNVGGKIYKYNFRFNNVSNDFTRMGFLTDIAWKLDSFTLNGMAGFYEDSYDLDRIGSDCDGNQRGVCKRKDNGYLLQVGLDWFWKPTTKLSMSYGRIDHNNKNVSVADTAVDQFYFGIAWSPYDFQGTTPFYEYFGKPTLWHIPNRNP